MHGLALRLRGNFPLFLFEILLCFYQTLYLYMSGLYPFLRIRLRLNGSLKSKIANRRIYHVYNQKNFNGFLAINITLMSVISNYKNTYAFDIPTAFWGTLEASRAFWTALNAGGAIGKGSISLRSFERSSRLDVQNLQGKILMGYHYFLFEKEKIRQAILYPDKSSSEIEQIALDSANTLFTKFENNAINVNNTTKSLSAQDYGYWKEYCKEIVSIAQNGLGSGHIQANTVINPRYDNQSGILFSSPKTNIGANCFTWNDVYFIGKGQYMKYDGTIIEYEPTNVPTDRIRVPYFSVNFTTMHEQFCFYGFTVDYNRLTGEKIAEATLYYDRPAWKTYDKDYIDRLISNTSFPVYVNPYLNDVQHAQDFSIDYNNLVVAVNGTIKDYQSKIVEALDETEAGKSIKQGIEENGDNITYIYNYYSTPVKISSLSTDEDAGVVSGVVGWDIPDARTLEGAIAVPEDEDDVKQGMGAITVADDDITSRVDDNVVSFPIDTPIDVPKVEEITDDPAKVITVTDVINVQGGEYYPTQIDITEFFPFCIPFDIAYCIKKFQVGNGEAPIIHIPVVYPKLLQSSLGESFDVVIDFNEYIFVRNIIRYFILLLFIVGLMTLTRNIIRG